MAANTSKQMHHVKLAIGIVGAAYVKYLFAHVPCTLRNCYHIHRQFAAACAIYALKN
jgi:hypothetical protein